MARTNHKGQTAADVRAERIREARDLAIRILAVVEIDAAEPEPADGWNWGHAGDWGAIVERLEDAAGAAILHGGEIVNELNLAQTFLRVRSLLTGSVPTAIKTYPVQRNGRTIRVTIPGSER